MFRTLFFNTLTTTLAFAFIASLSACTNSSLTPISNASAKNYSGEATLLVAVDGTDERKVRHIVIGTDEEPEGYEIYFHDKKVGEGFIPITLPTPSTNVTITEYSLTGLYGCSRGKAGYGSGSKSIAKITKGKTYFLGTINTSMNTSYNEMPKEYMKEVKSKYNYTPKGEDFVDKLLFRSHIKL